MESLCVNSRVPFADPGGHSIALWARMIVGQAFAGSGVRIELVLGRHVVVLAFPGD